MINKDKRITFRVDKSLYEKLKKKAETKDISVSEHIREIIEKGKKDGE